ncbi:MAG: helicase-exonuclease AddAB subunit AddB [Syntrophomonadaceae bacterium]|nr:helicase-exonuclease AddAB subunit AddB [Syntrophomonadaceae bacterium]
MSIRYILGRADTARTDYIISEIVNCLKEEGDHPLYLIVPEQFTLESEKNLIKGIGSSGILQAEVLSFNRLAYKVLNEAGGRTLSTINEQGKSMVLRKIIDELRSDLSAFAGASRQSGFIDIVSESLRDFKSNNIDSELLESFIDTLPADRLLKGKLNDLLLIYRGFNEYLTDSYIDMEDYINLVTRKLDSAEFLQNARIWIDGFDKFSPQLLKMIGKLGRLCENVTISLVMGDELKDRDREIFHVSRQTLKKLRELAAESRIPEKIIDLNQSGNKITRQEELLFLEKELFAYPYNKYLQPVKNLQVFAAANVRSEIENLTAMIISLVRENNYRFRDITVVCTDLEQYGSLLLQAFVENDIPFFLDEKRGIMGNPIIESILASLEIIIKGYRYHEVFRFIKAGFSNVSQGQGDELENYVLRYGIKGSIWKKPFTACDDEPLENINHAREMLIKPLEALERKVKKAKPCREMVSDFYDYLEDINLREKLETYIEELHEQKLFEYVNENTQIWNIVMMILDQLVEFLGDETVDLKQFHSLLESGFSSFRIGIIPTTVDEVVIGSISRSKSFTGKALFVIGANDGLLPARPEEHKLLSEEEILSLKDKGIDLGFDYDYRLAEENYHIYETLAKASDFLWISYALADEDGKPLHPSILIDRLKLLFPALVIKREKFLLGYQDMNMISTPKGTFSALILNLKDHLEGNEIGDFWWDVYEWYLSSKEWQDKLNAVLKGFNHKNQQDSIERDMARELYKTPFKTSISRLEKFNGCQFAHFIEYGLKPRDRKIFAMEAPDIGELFHLGLLTFARSLREKGREWSSLSQRECFELMDEIMDRLVLDYNSGILDSSHRFRYLVTRLKRICRRAAWTLTLHIKRGEFVPAFYEISFGIKGDLPPIVFELASGEKVYLEGRIDRVDLLETGDETYVRVIDYKSGSKNIELSDIYNGFSLQLFLYLDSVLQGLPQYNGKQAKPGGVFYFRIEDPMVETDVRDIEIIEREIFKKMKMTGLAIKDVDVIRQMDRDIAGYSEILPVQITRDGQVSERSNALTEEEFTALISYINRQVQVISEAILSGNTKIAPANYKGTVACRYCKYRSVCQFDVLFDNNRYRFVKKLDKEDVLRKIMAAGGGKKNG